MAEGSWQSVEYLNQATKDEIRRGIKISGFSPRNERRDHLVMDNTAGTDFSFQISAVSGFRFETAKIQSNLLRNLIKITEI